MSPHPRYNSQILTFFSRRFGILHDRTQELVRHTKMMGRWTAEVVLYPFVRIIQAQQTLGQRFNQTVAQFAGQAATTRKKQARIKDHGNSSTPILTILDAIELRHQSDLSPLPSIDDTDTTSMCVTISPQNGLARLVKKGVRALRHIHKVLFRPFSSQPLKAPLGLTRSAQLAHLEQNQTIPIQGIASLLGSRKIVLITPQQDVLDVLSPEQQQLLLKRMMQAVSRLNRKHHRQTGIIGDFSKQLTFTRGYRTKLKAKTDSSTPILRILEALELLDQPDESALQLIDSNRHKNIEVTIRPRAGLFGLVHQGVEAFQRVQQFFLKPFASDRIETPSGLSHRAQLTIPGRGNNIQIQGVASLLATKAIVLITPEQDVLDVLSSEQQQHLLQRMTHEISMQTKRNQRERILGKFAHLINRVRLPWSSNTKKSLPSISQSGPTQTVPNLLTNLRKWVFRSIVSTLATLPIVVIPAISASAAENIPLPKPKPEPQISELWVDPNHLKTPITMEELYGLVSGQTQGQVSLRSYPQNKIESKQTLDTSPQTSLNNHHDSQGHYGTEISIEAEFLGYEPHLLERILGWLDALMVHLEFGIATTWKWIGILVILCLTGLQKLRQLIPNS